MSESPALRALFLRLSDALKDANAIADRIRVEGGDAVRVRFFTSYNDDTGFSSIISEITTGRITLPIEEEAAE